MGERHDVSPLSGTYQRVAGSVVEYNVTALRFLDKL